MWWGSPALNLRTVIKSVWKLEKGNWVILRRLNLKPQLLVSHVPNSLERGQTSGWKDRLIIVHRIESGDRVYSTAMCVFYTTSFSFLLSQIILIKWGSSVILSLSHRSNFCPQITPITYGLLLRTNSDMTVYCSSGLCTLYT